MVVRQDLLEAKRLTHGGGQCLLEERQKFKCTYMEIPTEMLREGTLDGRVIIVTGGGSGLGLAMAKTFAKLGASVVITGRSQERLQAASQTILQDTGAQVHGIVNDVRDADGVARMMDECFEKFGTVHALVNNAAGNFISPTERLSTRAFDAVIDIVLKGTVNCTLALGKRWIEQKVKGAVLNIVTTYAWTGSAYVAPSACAKAGVLALTRSLAVEWGKYGIRTNAIAPGPFPTEGAWSRLLPGNLKEKFDLTKKIPLGRLGEHHELANLASFLLSDYAGFINGEVITIDGGEWLQGAGEFNMLSEIPDALWDQLEAMRKKR